MRTATDQTIEIVSSIVDDQNKVVANSVSTVSTKESATFKQEFIVKNPNLWSPDNPSMYSCETKLYVGGELKDTYNTPFGIRSIELKGNKGFFLNDEPIKFKGFK